MTAAEAIGSAGVALLSIAFSLNLAGILGRGSRIHQGLGCTGAGLACYAAYPFGYAPFVVLEGSWSRVAVVALARGAAGGGG